MADEEQRLRDIQREYLDFLDDEVFIIKFIIKKFDCAEKKSICKNS